MAEKKDNKGTIIIVLCTAITAIGVWTCTLWDKYDDCKSDRDFCDQKLDRIDSELEKSESNLIIKIDELSKAEDIVKEKKEEITELREERDKTLEELRKEEKSYESEAKINEHLRDLLRKQDSVIVEYKAKIKALEKEKEKYYNETIKLKKELLELTAKRIVAEKKSRTYSAINITDITQNSIKYDIVFDDEDFNKIKKRNYSKMEILTGLENLTTNKIIEPVEKKEGIYRRDSFSTIQAKYELGFVIPRGILKNYKKTVYERKTKGRDAFKITVFLKNNDKEKIAVRLFYLQRK